MKYLALFLCLGAAACSGGGSAPVAPRQIISPTPSPTVKPPTSEYTLAIVWSGALKQISAEQPTLRVRADGGSATAAPILVSTHYDGLQYSGEDAVASVQVSPNPSASPQVSYADSDPTQATVGAVPAGGPSSAPDAVGVFAGSAPGVSTLVATVTEPIQTTIDIQVSTYASSFVECAGQNSMAAYNAPYGVIFNNDGTITTTTNPALADLYVTGPPEECSGAFATAEGSNYEVNAPGGINSFPANTTSFPTLSAAQFTPGTTLLTIPTDGPGFSNFLNNTLFLLQTREGIYVKVLIASTDTSSYGAFSIPAADVANTNGVFTF